MRLGSLGPPPHCQPSFDIKLELITIPVINQTADAVLGRMMPNGDCVLVGDMTGGDRYPAYNLTIKNGAVSIACGIQSAININGTAVAINHLTANQTLSYTGSLVNTSSTLSDGTWAMDAVALLVNAGNQSSDGGSGQGFIVPPPISPFENTLNWTNSICMNGTGGSMCFPNGTYGPQHGTLGFDSTKVNTLTLWPGSSLNFSISEPVDAHLEMVHVGRPANPYRPLAEKFDSNQTAAADPRFAGAMSAMPNYEDHTFDVLIANGVSADCVCLFVQPRYHGDAVCLGPGGGDLPTALVGNVRSVAAHGNAAVEIFADSYGNKFAHTIDTYHEDLTELTYDANSNFAEHAHSVWIYLEPGSSATGTA